MLKERQKLFALNVTQPQSWIGTEISAN